MRGPILYGAARRHRDNKRKREWADRHPDSRRKNGRTDPGRFSAARYKAKRCGQEFALTLDQFASILRRPCTYCGYPLRETGSGLDRADNSKGYTIGNSVPSCRECNVAKGDFFTFQEMLDTLGPAIKSLKIARESAISAI